MLLTVYSARSELFVPEHYKQMPALVNFLLRTDLIVGEIPEITVLLSSFF